MIRCEVKNEIAETGFITAIVSTIAISVMTVALMIPGTASAAEIYITDYKSDADALVYVTKYKSEANCIVYETKYKSDKTPGVWYYTKYKSSARAKIHYTKYKSEADLIVYYTKYKSEAQCRY